MHPGPVVVDRVVLPAPGATGWLDDLRDRYEPEVVARGGAPAEVRWTAGDHPGTVTVVCQWHLPDLATFWAVRAAAGDPAVVAWWAATDALALRRERRVLAPHPVPVPRTGSRPGPDTGGAPRPDGTRVVVVGRPVGDPAAAVAGLEHLVGVVDGVRASHAGSHLPGVVAPEGLGDGACTWDLLLDHPDRLDAVLAAPEVGALVVPATTVVLDPVAAGGATGPATTVVKRTLLLTVRPDAPGRAVAGLEADLAAMPDHIPAIRSWSLARVRPGGSAGGGRWTHVWEQEFTELAGLRGDYMTSPFHWAVVDAWFDPQVPGHVVEPVLAHLFCARTPSLGSLIGRPTVTRDGAVA